MINNIKNYVRQNFFKITINERGIDIENYTDINNISENEIIILNENEKIIITGKHMTIKKLLNKEILISGSLLNISFIKTNE